MPEKEKKKSGGKGILIGLIVLLLGLNGAQFFMNYKKGQEQNEKLTAQASKIEEMDATAKEQMSKIDELIAKAEALQAENEELGIANEDLDAEIGALKKTKRYYAKNFMKPSVRKAMEAKISNYELMLNQQNEKIRQLKARNDSLFKETIVLKDTINTLGDSILELDRVNHDQADELRKGRILQAKEFKIIAVKNPDKNKIKYSDDHLYKNKDMKQTQLEFEIGSNPIALIEEKQVYVQIISPDKEIIHDMNQGGGNFTVNDEEKIYTVKQNIMYNRDSQKLSLIIDKPADYTTGTYKINIWCENEVIGKSSFFIK